MITPSPTKTTNVQLDSCPANFGDHGGKVDSFTFLEPFLHLLHAVTWGVVLLKDAIVSLEDSHNKWVNFVYHNVRVVATLSKSVPIAPQENIIQTSTLPSPAWMHPGGKVSFGNATHELAHPHGVTTTNNKSLTMPPSFQSLMVQMSMVTCPLHALTINSCEHRYTNESVETQIQEGTPNCGVFRD